MREQRKSMKHKLNSLIKSVAAVLVTSLALTGCSNVIPDMTVEEEQAIGEYAAFTLLKYDANHRSRLVDLSKVVEKDTKPQKPAEDTEKDPEQGGMGPVADTPIIDNTSNSASSIEEFFELPEGISFTYQGMQTCTSYQEPGQENGFSLEATEGKSLLVLQYNVSNQSQSAQRVDLYRQSTAFKITVNGSYMRTALMTMLTNDMSTYREDLQPGETKELVLLIEIDQSMADSITSVSLEVKNESNAYTISLLQNNIQ